MQMRYSVVLVVQWFGVGHEIEKVVPAWLGLGGARSLVLGGR